MYFKLDEDLKMENRISLLEKNMSQISDMCIGKRGTYADAVKKTCNLHKKLSTKTFHLAIKVPNNNEVDNDWIKKKL